MIKRTRVGLWGQLSLNHWNVKTVMCRYMSSQKLVIQSNPFYNFIRFKYLLIGIEERHSNFLIYSRSTLMIRKLHLTSVKLNITLTLSY